MCVQSLNQFLGQYQHLIQAAVAVGTLAAVIVALFQERIKDYFSKARLKMEIILAPPDSHLIALGESIDKLTALAIYIRIRVTHLSGKPAEDVEIMATKCWKILDNETKEIKSSFLPMNLVWSHFQPRQTNIRVPSGVFRHCDFGHIQGVNGHSILILDTMVQPNPVAKGEVPNIIKPGKYVFELMLTGRNTSVIRKSWEVKIDNDWSNSEDEMLNNRIQIREVSNLD